MKQQDFYKDFANVVLSECPSTQFFFKNKVADNNKAWENMVFPEVLSIPFSVVEEMEKVVQEVHVLKKNPDYLKDLKKDIPAALSHFNFAHPQDSVLMAYDFHIDSEGHPRLIEVNTNGSGFLIGNAIYQAHGLPYKKALESLRNSFQSEWSKFLTFYRGKRKKERPEVAIVDEQINSQKMIWEFFMYKDFFQSMDWSANIYEASDLIEGEEGSVVNAQGQSLDFIYNRLTDFYLRRFPVLLQAYVNQKACLSPHPLEYYLLSDKKRLCLWFDREDLREIKKNLIFSQLFNEEKKEQIWAQKKNLFFKMSQGYGGKQVYRGKNLTKGKFQMMSQGETVIQEYVKPSLWKDSQGVEWKFDLRAFVYAGEIQQLLGRCYQGQVTQFQNKGGGFASVKVL